MSLPISIDQLISGNVVENHRIEYKAGWDPEPIMHTICAFANDYEGYSGGYIVIGVEAKNGIPILPIKGLDITEIDRIQNEILEFSKKCIYPNYVPSIEVVDFDFKKIIVLWVYQGYDKPYKAVEHVYLKNNKSKLCYIRKGSSILIANNSEEKELFRSSEIIPFDDRINRNATIEDLKPSLIKEYLKDIKSDLLNHFEEIGFESICESLHIIDGPKEDLHPKNVGLLMFNDSPEDFLPYSYIIVDYIPNPSGDEIYTQEFHGTLIRQIKDATQYIKNSYIIKQTLKQKDKIESNVVYNYPIEIIDELIPNAVLHKDYQIREPITIRITNERIEITSFPGFDSTITDSKIRENNFISRKYRNKRIAEFLREEKLIEAKNTGIPKVIRALEKNNSPKLEFETNEEREFLTVIIKINSSFLSQKNILDNDFNKTNTKIKDKIIEILYQYPKGQSLTELSKLLGYNSISNALKLALKKLLREGKIKKIKYKYFIS